MNQPRVEQRSERLVNTFEKVCSKHFLVRLEMRLHSICRSRVISKDIPWQVLASPLSSKAPLGDDRAVNLDLDRASIPRGIGVDDDCRAVASVFKLICEGGWVAEIQISEDDNQRLED